MTDGQPNPNSGASGTELMTLEAIRDIGCTVDAVWASDLSTHISHYNLRYLIELPLALRIELKRRLSVQSYDVVHVSQPHGYLAAKWLKEHYPGAVYVHRSHGFEGRVREDLAKWRMFYSQNKQSFVRRMASGGMQRMLQVSQRMIAKYATGHIVSASQCRGYLMNRYNLPGNKIAVVPQAPPQAFHEKPAPPLSERRLKKLLCVGQFAFVKGTPVLASVVTSLLRQSPELTFTWVCSEQHHAEARRLFPSDLEGRVNLISWREQFDLISVYDTHGIFLFPSFFEGFGKAFLEAMSRGLVVVAADNGGMRDTINHGENGFLFQTGNAKAMTYICNLILNNIEASMFIGNNARRAALKFTWHRTALETTAFYRSLLEKKYSGLHPNVGLSIRSC